jgi:hypothetical protein
MLATIFRTLPMNDCGQRRIGKCRQNMIDRSILVPSQLKCNKLLTMGMKRNENDTRQTEEEEEEEEKQTNDRM